MAILGKFNKQPAEVKDYDIDLSEWLDEDTIFSHTATATPAGLTLTSSIKDGAKAVKVVVAGGTVGIKYKVEVTATTVRGLVDQEEFIVTVKEV